MKSLKSANSLPAEKMEWIVYLGIKMTDGALGPGQSRLVSLPSDVFFFSDSVYHLRDVPEVSF